jgi:phosphatidate cytidylyltransferase
MSSSLVRRVVVAAVGIPAAFGLVYLGGWLMAGTLGLLGAIGAWEVYRLAGHARVRPVLALGVGGAAAIPLVVFAAMPAGLGWGTAGPLLAGAGWLIAITAAVARWRRPSDQPLAAASITLFGACYAAGLPTFLLLLRYPDDVWVPRLAATWLVFLPLVVTWVCDSFAMAGGSLIGGPHLAPVLSPRKTWSGAIVGAISALLVAPLYGRLVLREAGVVAGDWPLVVVGLVIGVVGQAGDVAESLFKREAGVKDSGAFFPGHGGVLDRLDSLYWGIPGTALVLKVFGVI